MAIYLVSLPRLASLRARRAASEAVLRNAAERQPSAAGKAAPEEVTEDGADVPSMPFAPPSGKSPDVAGSVEDLLHLPKSQIEALLSQGGESGSKALLALICRLASLEAQVADLSTRVRSVPGSSLPPTSAAAGHGEVRDAGKTTLLEQVFRKNLFLRGMD